MSRLDLVLVLVLVLGAGCRQDMHDQPRLEPYEASSFFADGRGSRPLVEGTVPRGDPVRDPHLHDGRGPDGKLVETFPEEVTKATILRGRERFEIFCSPCHNQTGDGNGMIVRRGLRRPPSFHDPRLRAAPVGHFYDAIAHGFGAMSDYAAQIPVRDRWAIVAYIRALQLSQSAAIADVPADERKKLEEAPR